MVLILVFNGKGQGEVIKHVVHVTLCQAERSFCILSGQEALTAYFQERLLNVCLWMSILANVMQLVFLWNKWVCLA